MISGEYKIKLLAKVQERGYSSEVEHSTADREVSGSIPDAPWLYIKKRRSGCICSGTASVRNAYDPSGIGPEKIHPLAECICFWTVLDPAANPIRKRKGTVMWHWRSLWNLGLPQQCCRGMGNRCWGSRGLTCVWVDTVEVLTVTNVPFGFQSSLRYPCAGAIS